MNTVDSELSFLWESLDAYESGYSSELRGRRQAQQEALEERWKRVQMEVAMKALQRDKDALWEENLELQRRLDEQEGHLMQLHRKLDKTQTSVPVQLERSSPCGTSNEESIFEPTACAVNYFADAIDHQRELYNNLKRQHDRLQSHLRTKEAALINAEEENKLVRDELLALQKHIKSHESEAESLLSSGFLNKHRNPVATLQEYTREHASSENLISSLNESHPLDILRHRLLNIDGITFELFCCSLFLSIGYSVKHCGGPNDLGIDFELKEKDTQKTWRGVGQCKRYNRKISSQDIREFTGSMLSYGCHTGYFLTTSTFTRDALQAKQKAVDKNISIELWDINDICTIISNQDKVNMLLHELDSHTNFLKSRRGIESCSNNRINDQTQNDAKLDDICSMMSDLRLPSSNLLENCDHNASPAKMIKLEGNKENHESTPQKQNQVSDSEMSFKRQLSGQLMMSPPSTPCTVSRLQSNAFRDTPSRESDMWLEEEVDALKMLIKEFKSDESGKVSWSKMEQWLRCNEEKRSSDSEHGGNSYVRCALRPVHFDKEKLRCRWKNECKKVKQVSN